MSQYNIIYLIIIAALGILFIYEWRTGKSIFAKVTAGQPILEALKLLTKACTGVFPSRYFDTASIVIEACINATVNAEDAWKIGQIPKEERNAYCQLLIARNLKEVGIIITDQVQEVIDGAIALICMLMPHSALAEKEKEKEEA